MRLTDNEIRDITGRLEAGQLLPDYYRFLLFEEKREAELVRNGKTNVMKEKGNKCRERYGKRRFEGNC